MLQLLFIYLLQKSPRKRPARVEPEIESSTDDEVTAPYVRTHLTASLSGIIQ